MGCVVLGCVVLGCVVLGCVVLGCVVWSGWVARVRGPTGHWKVHVTSSTPRHRSQDRVNTFVDATNKARFVDQTASTWYAHLGSRTAVGDYDLAVADLLDGIVQSTTLSEKALTGVAWVYGTILRREALPAISTSRGIWDALQGIPPSPSPTPAPTPSPATGVLTTTTAAASPSPSPSPSPSAAIANSSPSPTPTSTRTPTPTQSPPKSLSPTVTQTATLSPTPSPTPSLSPSLASAGTNARRPKFDILEHLPESFDGREDPRTQRTRRFRAQATSAAPSIRSKMLTVLQRNAQTAIFRDAECLQSDPSAVSSCMPDLPPPFLPSLPSL